MNRQILILALVPLLFVFALLTVAVSIPVVTAQGPAVVTLTPVPDNVEPPAGAPEPTATPSDAGAAPAEPVAPVEVAPAIGDPAPVLDAVAADLTLFADLTFGAGVRPEGWTSSLTADNPQYALLLRLNLEILAGQVAGPDARPVGWFGAVPSSPFAIARDIRHDLELLANTVNNPPLARPQGWRGDDPIMQCGRAVQALVGVLEAGGVFRLEADPTSADYCVQAEIQATQFAERNLLSNAAASRPANVPAGTESVLTEFAVSFLDRGASQRAGLMPVATTFTPIARSYAQFSNMMLAQGEGFLVFVDYQQTSVSPEAFDALPDVNGIQVEPFCTTDWCGGE